MTLLNKLQKKEKDGITIKRKGDRKMKELTAIELYDKLVDEELFTEEELRLLTNINGFNVETLNDAIFSRYGYRDYNQMMEE